MNKAKKSTKTQTMKAKQNKLAIRIFGLILLLSLIVLAGWLIKNQKLAGLYYASVPMAPVTALCFLLISISGLNFSLPKFTPVVGKALLFLVFLTSLLVLIDAVTEYPFKIESIFISTSEIHNNFPIGRMSPVTSILFLISTFALWSVQSIGFWRRLGLYLSSITLVVAFTFDLGYLYGTPLLYGGNIIPPAWNTSLAFTLLFFVIIAGFGQNELPVSLFKGDSVNARLLRGVLPVTLLIIILGGWVDTIFFKIFNNYVLVSALVTIFSTLILGFIILKISKIIGNDINQIFEFKKEAEEALKESELHFRTLADSGQALIWTSGLDKKCNYFNKTWLDFTGRTLEQELGDGWVEGVHPDDVGRCVSIYVDAFEKQEKFSMDYRLKYNDGSYRWIQDSGTPRYNLNNEFIGYIGHCLDITAQKEAMQAVKQSEERFRSTLDSMMEGAQIIGFDWKYIYLNDSADRHNRRPKEDLLGRYVMDCWSGYEYTEIYAIEKKCMEDRVSIHREIEFTFFDGTNGWFDVSIQPVPEGIFALSIDISERKKAEQLLKESEERYRLISSVSTDYTFSTLVLPDGSLAIDWVAGAFESISGYTLQEFKELGGWRATVHPDDFHIDDLDLARLKNNEDTSSQIRTINRDGKIVWVQVYAHPVWNTEKNCLQRIYGAVRDITHQKQAENKLKVSEEKYRSIFENSNVAILLTNPIEGKILSANHFACKLFGYTETEIYKLGREGLIDKTDSRIHALIQERSEKGYAKGEVSFIRKGGEKFECEISSVIFTDSEGKDLTSIVIRDLTEQKFAESKIQKLNEELELKVKDRTAELEQKNSDLVRMNKLFVGRELRMVELKQMLKECEDRLKIKPKFD